MAVHWNERVLEQMILRHYISFWQQDQFSSTDLIGYTTQNLVGDIREAAIYGCVQSFL